MGTQRLFPEFSLLFDFIMATILISYSTFEQAQLKEVSNFHIHVVNMNHLQEIVKMSVLRVVAPYSLVEVYRRYSDATTQKTSHLHIRCCQNLLATSLSCFE